MSKLLTFLAVVYAALAIWFFPKWTVDDGYITFRYAENLARHGELTWNPGEDPIEGYTGVLLPLLLTAGIKLDVSPVIASQIIGVIGLALSAIFLWLSLRELDAAPTARGATLLVYLTLPFLYTNTLSGLETMLYIGLLTASAWCFISGVKQNTDLSVTRLSILSLLLLMTSLTRPEGALWSALSLIGLSFYFYRHKPDKKSFKKLLFAALFFYLLPALVYFLWRYNYYGYLLPNTFYAKSRAGLHLNHLKDFIHFSLTYLAAPVVAGALIFLPTADEAVGAARPTPSWRAWRGFMCVSGAFIGLTLLQYTNALLKMNFSYRFFVPFVPLILITLGYFVSLGLRQLELHKNSAPLRNKLIFALVAVAALLQLLTVTHRLKDERRFASDYKLHLTNQHLTAGEKLREFIPSGQWLAMFYDAGAVPFISQLKTIDMGGLNDEYITHHKPNQAQMVEYFYKIKPAAAVFTSYAPDRVSHDPVAEGVIADPRFTDYRLLQTYPSPASSPTVYHLYVYIRKDAPKDASAQKTVL